LNNLHVGVEDISYGYEWGGLLLDTIQSSNGIWHLPHPYWELLLELAVLLSNDLEGYPYSPHVMTSLEAAREWDKLECWMGVLWMVWSPEDGRTPPDDGPTREDLEHMTLTLFHQ
jgi:hypothetical protein